MMPITSEVMSAIVDEVVRRIQRLNDPWQVVVGVSNRHIHLCAEHFYALFGQDASLTNVKDLIQTGQYAAAEKVTIQTPKGAIKNVRILGPLRKQTQVEISQTDCIALGVNAPMRESGQLSGTPGITLVGPNGTVTLNEGVIVAQRHVHLNPERAAQLSIVNGEMVDIAVDSPRGLTFQNVVARVSPDYMPEIHVDTDEANAAGLKTGDYAKIIKRQGHVALSPAPAATLAKGRKIVTYEDVAAVKRTGNTRLQVPKNAIITPLAKDEAKRLGVDLICT